MPWMFGREGYGRETDKANDRYPNAPSRGYCSTTSQLFRQAFLDTPTQGDQTATVPPMNAWHYSCYNRYVSPSMLRSRSFTH